MAQAINWKQLREQYESTEEYRTQVIIFFKVLNLNLKNLWENDVLFLIGCLYWNW